MTLLYHILIHLVTHIALATTARVVDRAPGGVPQGWVEVKTPDAGEQLQLRIALRQSNVEQFDQTVLAISTPGNPRYGKHLQPQEVRSMLQPTEAATRTVMSWLESAHIHDVNDDGDWIHFRTNVSSANALLDTKFMWYRSPYKNRMLLRTVEYSLPENIIPHVNLVQPTTRFGSGQPLGSQAHQAGQIDQFFSPLRVNNGIVVQASGVPTDSSCNSTIYPSCLLQLYNVHYKPDADNGNKIGVANFLEQFSRNADRADFNRRFAPWADAANLTRTEFGNPVKDQDAPSSSEEANLDAQYINAVSAPIPMTEFTTAGRGPTLPSTGVGGTQSNLFYNSANPNYNEPYLDYLLALRKVPNEELPQTISHSYGEDEQSVPEAYVRQVCQMFGELGSRGVSVIFASGDSGVGTYCAQNDNPTKFQFQAMFPAACPTVTSVGGTWSIPEVAANYSGGGFSRLFPRPDWQEEAVLEYWNERPDVMSRFGTYFNSSNRGFPDVSAQSYRYAVVDKANLQALQGTSASAPTFAGIVALLNGARIDIGLPPLGFLNPWLYGDAATAFTDITEGGSTGCNGLSAFNQGINDSPVIVGSGWNASIGWDPVSGLGTPDFGKLLAIAAPGVENSGGPSLGGLPGALSTDGNGTQPTNGTAGATAINDTTTTGLAASSGSLDLGEISTRPVVEGTVSKPSVSGGGKSKKPIVEDGQKSRLIVDTEGLD